MSTIARLEIVRQQISIVEKGMQDMEALLDNAILDQQNDLMWAKIFENKGDSFIPKEFYNFNVNDPNVIRHKLYALRAVDGELRTNESYLNEVALEEKKQNAQTMTAILPGKG